MRADDRMLVILRRSKAIIKLRYNWFVHFKEGPPRRFGSPLEESSLDSRTCGDRLEVHAFRQPWTRPLDCQAPTAARCSAPTGGGRSRFGYVAVRFGPAVVTQLVTHRRPGDLQYLLDHNGLFGISSTWRSPDRAPPRAHPSCSPARAHPPASTDRRAWASACRQAKSGGSFTAEYFYEI